MVDLLVRGPSLVSLTHRSTTCHGVLINSNFVVVAEVEATVSSAGSLPQGSTLPSNIPGYSGSGTTITTAVRVGYWAQSVTVDPGNVTISNWACDDIDHVAPGALR